MKCLPWYTAAWTALGFPTPQIVIKYLLETLPPMFPAFRSSTGVQFLHFLLLPESPDWLENIVEKSTENRRMFWGGLGHGSPGFTVNCHQSGGLSREESNQKPRVCLFHVLLKIPIRTYYIERGHLFFWNSFWLYPFQNVHVFYSRSVI